MLSLLTQCTPQSSSEVPKQSLKRIEDTADCNTAFEMLLETPIDTQNWANRKELYKRSFQCRESRNNVTVRFLLDCKEFYDTAFFKEGITQLYNHSPHDQLLYCLYAEMLIQSGDAANARRLYQSRLDSVVAHGVRVDTVTETTAMFIRFIEFKIQRLTTHTITQIQFNPEMTKRVEYLRKTIVTDEFMDGFESEYYPFGRNPPKRLP